MASFVLPHNINSSCSDFGVSAGCMTYRTTILTGYMPQLRALSGGTVKAMRPFLSVTSVEICCHSPPGGSRMM
ncbi:hypothetical protein E2C01_002808 [Portunus trituberculatus]|uniref:Uncharacterized protein n=1 Tax=Portunus trituberculatus TaxID=210409 RepID=A0A5B7CM82_PORTR|nr:hypothetical protein [Portunus trituberculatus]